MTARRWRPSPIGARNSAPRGRFRVSDGVAGGSLSQMSPMAAVLVRDVPTQIRCRQTSVLRETVRRSRRPIVHRRFWTSRVALATGQRPRTRPPSARFPQVRRGLSWPPLTPRARCSLVCIGGYRRRRWATHTNDDSCADHDTEMPTYPRQIGGSGRLVGGVHLVRA